MIIHCSHVGCTVVVINFEEEIMFDNFIMVSQMLVIIEENKRQRILAELDKYDQRVVATVKEVLTKMAKDENREYDVSLIWAENDENFRQQFMDLTGKFGYLVVQHTGIPNQRFLSTLYTRK